MLVKRVGPGVGDGAAPQQSTEKAHLLFAVQGEHSCVLPLLPYTSVLKNLAGKESRTMGVSASRACAMV